MQDIKTKLAYIEKERLVLVATDGENVAVWERIIEADVRVKYRAALLVGAEGLKKLETESPTAASRTHTAAASSRSATKREPVSLPKFEGSEKPGNSPFLHYPVWLDNWQERIVDYEAKS